MGLINHDVTGQIEYQKFLQEGGENYPTLTKRNVIRFVTDIINEIWTPEPSEEALEKRFEEFFGKFTR